MIASPSSSAAMMNVLRNWPSGTIGRMSAATFSRPDVVAADVTGAAQAGAGPPDSDAPAGDAAGADDASTLLRATNGAPRGSGDVTGHMADDAGERTSSGAAVAPSASMTARRSTSWTRP